VNHFEVSNKVPFQKWLDRNPELDSVIDCPLCEGEGFDEGGQYCPLCEGVGDIDTAYEIYLSDIVRDEVNLRRICHDNQTENAL
jgi:RecJ-like exonuclease